MTSPTEKVPETLSALEQSPNIHRIIITDRSGEHLYDNSRSSDGSWVKEPRAGESVRELRGEGCISFGAEEAKAWLSSYWEHGEAMLRRGELGSTTAPTFIRLHEDADRIAKVAYQDDPKAVETHDRWQKVQKGVFLAGRNGVPNDRLPTSPEAFYAAAPEERARFARNIVAGVDSSAVKKGLGWVDATGVKSAQGLLGGRRAPSRGGGPVAQSRVDGPRNPSPGKGKDSGLGR